MIKANSENTKPSSWFPGSKPEDFALAPRTARALEIAKRREELLGLLNDLPESDYELSLTDLVEKSSAVNDTTQVDKAVSEGEAKEESIIRERKKKRNGRKSISGSSEGVLLNMYVPSSLTRSRTSSSSSRGSSQHEIIDSNKRERDQVAFRCWSAIWERRCWTSRQQELERAR